MPSLISPEVLGAYRKTEYVLQLDDHELILHIDEYSASLQGLHTLHGVKSSAFLTACNPHSERYTVAQNVFRQDLLKADLVTLGCVIVAGAGRDPDGKWPQEPSFFVLGISRRDSARLGKKYGQNAVVYSADEAVPRLICL